MVADGTLIPEYQTAFVWPPILACGAIVTNSFPDKHWMCTNDFEFRISTEIT